ncbi:MAG: hypothetical protein SYC29_08800, partial [Planctomycetota bacterium]|nr:hypothetical protein [Planctomycetota bacterium]
MATPDGQIEQLLGALEERAKELNCLYHVDEILSRPEVSVDEACTELLHAVPPGWQHPDICRCRLVLGEDVYEPDGFSQTPWWIGADLCALDEKVGEIRVYYTERRPVADEGPFLRDERRLINAIADRVSIFLEQRSLAGARESGEGAGGGPVGLVSPSAP